MVFDNRQPTIPKIKPIPRRESRVRRNLLYTHVVTKLAPFRDSIQLDRSPIRGDVRPARKFHSLTTSRESPGYDYPVAEILPSPPLQKKRKRIDWKKKKKRARNKERREKERTKERERRRNVEHQEIEKEYRCYRVERGSFPFELWPGLHTFSRRVSGRAALKGSSIDRDSGVLECGAGNSSACLQLLLPARLLVFRRKTVRQIRVLIMILLNRAHLLYYPPLLSVPLSLSYFSFFSPSTPSSTLVLRSSWIYCDVTG